MQNFQKIQPSNFRRGEIRFANLALISGRQMSIRAITMSIFLVAMTRKTAAQEGISLHGGFPSWH